jgi:predicted DNA-binding mobile mystery protein A
MIRRDLARKNLDRRFAKLKPADQWARPPKGWLRAIRDAVGMTAAQMAARLGVSQPRILALEKDEVRGGVTLDMLSRAAQALDCTLVYALVPNQPLEEMVQKRAEKAAAERIVSVDHTMRLEHQGLSREELQAERERLAAELLRGNPRRLWDEPK